jgi:hypothetical protein
MFPLPLGEGEGKDENISSRFSVKTPHPNPLLKGEGE